MFYQGSTKNCLQCIKQFTALIIYLGDKPQCNQNTPCDFGKGICWTDDDCKGDLFCGKSNCVGELLDPWNNCCTNDTSTGTTITNLLHSKYWIFIENFNELGIQVFFFQLS